MKRFILTLLVCLSTMLTYAASGTTYTVQANSLNVRQKPNAESTILGKVTQGQKVLVMSISGGWAYISYHKGYGYVSAQYLKKGNVSSKSTASNSKSSTTSSSSKSASSDRKFPYSDGRGPRYGGWTEGGLTFGMASVGFSADLVNGCYIRDFIFVGAGVGFHGNFSPYFAAQFSLPIYAQTRGTLHINRIFATYLDLGIGGYVGWGGLSSGLGYNSWYQDSDYDYDDNYDSSYNDNTNNVGGGFYLRIVPGIKIGKHFHLGLGYEHCGWNNGVLVIGADW